MHRLVTLLLVLGACAPKRAAHAVATGLQAPDAGAFDFSGARRDEASTSTGDLDHPGKVPGTTVGLERK